MNDEEASITRRRLCDLYKDVHIGRQEKNLEKLKQQGRQYLSNVKFKKKFKIIPFDTLLEEIIKRTGETKADAFLEIQKGFSNLEKYGINLLQRPWRKEFQSIKLYSSFYKHEIEPQVPAMFATPILHLYGYKPDGSKDILKIEEPIAMDNIFTISFELFLVTIELQVMLEIAKEIKLYTFDVTVDVTLEDVLDARKHSTGDVEDAKKLLLKVKSISSERKRIKLDTTETQRKRKGSKDDNFSNVRSRSFPQDVSEPQTVYSHHNTSRGGNAVTTRVTHVASTNGVEGLTEAELYGYTPPVVPTYAPHYPQVTGAEGESDYVNMSDTNDYNDYYEVMTPQATPHLPPPTYRDAVHPQFPDNVMKEYVVVPSPTKPLDHDAASAIPGISGLNIRENGTDYTEKGGKIENGILPEMKTQKHRKKERGSAEHIEMDQISTRSSRTKVPPAVTTSVTYNSSSLNNDKMAGGMIGNGKSLNGKVINSYDKLQARSGVSSESYSRSSKNDLPSDSHYVPSSSKTSDRLSSSKDQLGSNKIKFPPATTMQTEPQKSLHEDKQKTAYKEQQEYTSRKESQKRYCLLCTKEATHVCTICNKVCCKSCRSVFHTLPCEGATVHHLVDRSIKEKMVKDENCVSCGKLSDYECYQCQSKSKNSRTTEESAYEHFKLSTPNSKEQYRGDTNGNNAQHQNENCAYCRKDSTHECQNCKIKSCNVCHHVKGTSDQCKSAIGHFFKPLAPNSIPHYTEMPSDLNSSNICEFCGLTATFICADCHNRICKQCQHIYEKDHCPATKKDHFFQLITSQTKIEPKEKPWACGRCTFSNPPQNKICAMCATSQGVTSVEFPDSGSRKCAHCTYGNTEHAKICVMCGRTLARDQMESYI